MHKNVSITLSTLLIAITTFFIACNDDIQLIGDRTEVPVVYGTISASDPFVFVRLERVFADNEISPTVIAKNPDSLYYNNAIVNIARLDSNWSVNLNRVDATTLGFPRDTGIFATSPNYIYMVNASEFKFKPGVDYKLTIDINGKQFTSTTTLVSPVEIRQPRQGIELNWIPNPEEVLTRAGIFQYNNFQNVPASAFPKIFNLAIRFNYSEQNLNVSTDYVNKSIIIPVINGVTSVNERFNYSINGIYSHLGANLEASPQIRRYSGPIDFILTGGGQEFLNYNEALSANAGITSTQDFPVFTNIEGGFGIFASKHTQEFKPYYLNPASIDSLTSSRYTKNLNFTH